MFFVNLVGGCRLILIAFHISFCKVSLGAGRVESGKGRAGQMEFHLKHLLSFVPWRALIYTAETFVFLLFFPVCNELKK